VCGDRVAHNIQPEGGVLTSAYLDIGDAMQKCIGAIVLLADVTEGGARGDEAIGICRGNCRSY